MMKRKLRKSKVFRAIASFVIGILNSNPITSIVTPSIADFNAKLDAVEGQEQPQSPSQRLLHHLLSYMGMFATLYLIIWGIKTGLEKDTIEWAAKLLLKSAP